MAEIEFRHDLQEFTILRPPDFSPETQRIEYRQDPLTGVRCRLNRNRVHRPKQVPPAGAVHELLGKPANCPFCPENIESATPRFPGEICEAGFYQVGECRLFPNLFALARFHANISLTKEHFVPVGRFGATTLGDAWQTAFLFFRDVVRLNSRRLYPLVCWNHLPPSGGSIIHPHMQVLLDRVPTAYQHRLLEASGEYHRRTGNNYFEDLALAEKEKGERFVGENSSVWVLASYAPQGNREFQIVFKRAVNLLDLDGEAKDDFISAVLKLLGYYHRSGVDSFNLTTLSAALGEKVAGYHLGAKLIARPAVQPLYRNDTGILERVHYEADVEIAPEVLAQEAREYFR